MIVCHCQNITDHEINAAVGWIRAADPNSLITPGKIRRLLGKPAVCGSCMNLFIATMCDNKNLEIKVPNQDFQQTNKDQKSCKAKKRSSNISTRHSVVS